MFNLIFSPIQNGFNNTFGDMNGKEVLWTIIGLLCLYQLVMIKWRLIDQARANRTPHSFMAPQGRWINRRNPTPTRILESMNTGTPFIPDSARNSTSEPADEKIIIPNLDDIELIGGKPSPRSYAASSQAGLASFQSGRYDLRNMQGVDGQGN